MLAARFELTDHHGKPVSNATFLGRYVLVFFGFTHCRVVCPRALRRISSALALLGNPASSIVPLYISVDPERDTPAVLRSFLETQYPRFTGLTGSREAADAAKKSFRVFAQRQADANEPGGYVVPHTAFTYLLDPAGDYLAHFSDTLDEAELAARLGALVAHSIVAHGTADTAAR